MDILVPVGEILVSSAFRFMGQDDPIDMHESPEGVVEVGPGELDHVVLYQFPVIA